MIIIILSVLTLFRCFVNLGNTPLERWDEQTNVAVIVSGKPFFEKPPLWYWITTAVTSIMDVSPFSIRLISAVSGCIIIASTAYIAWKWWGRIAGIAAWITLLTTNHLFVNNAGEFFSSHTFRSADLDALQIVFILISFIASISINSSKKAVYITGICSGLAVLTKGPLGFVVLGIASITFGRRTLPAWGVALLMVIPWYLIMTILHGSEFLAAHFGYHIGARTFVPLEGHVHPAWYYLQILSHPGVFLFAPVLLGAIVWIIIHRSVLRDIRLHSVLLMTIVLFLIPTIMQTRLAWYILPIYPFAALIIGYVVARNCSNSVVKS